MKQESRSQATRRAHLTCACIRSTPRLSNFVRASHSHRQARTAPLLTRKHRYANMEDPSSTSCIPPPCKAHLQQAVPVPLLCLYYSELSGWAISACRCCHRARTWLCSGRSKLTTNHRRAIRVVNRFTPMPRHRWSLVR